MLNRTRSQEFAAALELWRVDAPGVPDVLAMWTALDDLATDNPVTALRQRIASGEVTAKNIVKEVRTAALTFSAAGGLGSILPDVDGQLARLFAIAVESGADGIVEQLSPHFDKAATDLTASVEVLPVGATAEEVLTMGQQVATAWHQAANAAQRLDSIADVRMRMTRHYNYGDTERPAVAAFLAGPLTVDELNRAVYIRRGDHLALRVNALPQARGGSWEHLIRGGFTLKLNNADETAHNGVRPLDPEPVAA